MRATAREPRSVVHDGDRAVAAIRAMHEMFDATAGDEAVAWARLQARRHRRRRVWPLLLLGATAGAGAIAVVLALRADHASPPPPSASIDTARVLSPVVEQLPAPEVLAAGSSLLPGSRRVHLRDGARAVWLESSPGAGHLVLESGTLEVDAPAPVEVHVGSLRVDGSAGRFKVSTRPGRIDLAVDKGQVAVWSPARRLAVVVAGERWRWPPETADDPEPAPRPSATSAAKRGHGVGSPAVAPREEPDAPVPASEERDCLRLARDGVTDAAIVCFERQTAQPGLTGELAFLELARIRRDVKGDVAGAERLLAEHRRRFPHGALAAEARTIRVELLLRLGRAAEALAEAERLTDVEAIFWRAVCLDSLGRRDEARRGYDEYLRHGDIERRGEATRKLGKLGSPGKPAP
jgi:hypothetical protein